jgi:DNA-binding NarL/FixJ family response regulator
MSNTKDDKTNTLIKVVTVDSNAEENYLFELFLQQKSDIELVYQATAGKEAHIVCKQLTPDVIIIRRNLGDMSDVDLLKALLIDCPLSGIVMVSCCNEADWMRDVLMAGGKFFLSTPLQGHEIWRVVYGTYQYMEKIRKLYNNE